MSERITDNYNPSNDEVREWGYDEDLFFMEQDEDLLLYHVSYLPVLLELAQNSQCPKRGYALNILGQFVRGMAGGNRDAEWGIVEQTVTGLVPVDDAVREWRDYVLRLLSYRKTPFAVRGAMGDRMAHDLLLGIGRIGNIVRAPSDNRDVLRFALTTSYTEDLRINRKTGEWTYQRIYR